MPNPEFWEQPEILSADWSHLKCPDCGAAMARKKSKFGEFYGCTTWSIEARAQGIDCQGSVTANWHGTPMGIPVNKRVRELRKKILLWAKDHIADRDEWRDIIVRTLDRGPQQDWVGIMDEDDCLKLLNIIDRWYIDPSLSQITSDVVSTCKAPCDTPAWLSALVNET